jgi:hypothetical protein
MAIPGRTFESSRTAGPLTEAAARDYAKLLLAVTERVSNI